MVDTADSDLLMYFIHKGSDPIAAQSNSVLVAADKLTSDFKVGKFFEAETFSFSIKLEDDEGGEGGGEESSDSRSYARWRAIKQDGVKPTPPFLAEPEDFSITRMIDSSSPILMQHCLDMQRLDKAVLVKRRRLASSGALAGFLRLEFDKVWLKSIEWTDGEAVKETCKFKYAFLKVTYLKRKPDGTTASSWPCKWEPASNA